jgi:hypothetical protein
MYLSAIHLNRAALVDLLGSCNISMHWHFSRNMGLTHFHCPLWTAITLTGFPDPALTTVAFSFGNLIIFYEGHQAFIEAQQLICNGAVPNKLEALS